MPCNETGHRRNLALRGEPCRWPAYDDALDGHHPSTSQSLRHLRHRRNTQANSQDTGGLESLWLVQMLHLLERIVPAACESGSPNHTDSAEVRLRGQPVCDATASTRGKVGLPER